MSPRSANPQAASSATATLSSPRPSEKSIDLMSASGYLSDARLVRFLTFWLMKDERASSTAAWSLSSHVVLLAMLYLLGLSCMDSRNLPGSGADGNISAVPNGNIRNVSGRYLSAISTVSKRAIAQIKPLLLSAVFFLCSD